ncbi:hypothetical protein MVEG_10974 [Podila verticillata NRRL 6337]|nr:hypothetical protein MVEG_10974 [Podila verticillata NRRL 6337]
MPYFKYSSTALGRGQIIQNNDDNDSDPGDDLEPEIFGDFVVKPRYPQHNKTKSTRMPSDRKKDAQNQQCTLYIPPEILDIICLFVDQTTLCRSLRLVSRIWYTIATRHIDRKGNWTLGPQQDKDRLLADIEHGLINVLQLNYKADVLGYWSNHAISPTGRMEPYQEWPWAWSKIVTLLSENPSNGMDDTQSAARNDCLMHRIERLTVRSTTIWDPIRVPALLPSMKWIRELELDALDCSTTIEVFPILDLCSNLALLSIHSTGSSAAVNIQHGAINNLLDACPRLQSCKILQSSIGDLEGATIHDYSELSSITEMLYRRAALVCPRLTEFHLPPVGPWDSTKDPDGHESGILTLKLAQELFPQTRFFSLQCCMPRTWRPSHDIRHLLGQLTHIEIDTELPVDLEGFNWILGYTYSLLHLSASNIRYHRTQPSILQSADAERSPKIVCWEDSLIQQQRNDTYSWMPQCNKHYFKKLRRANKRLHRENTSLDLGVTEVSSQQETFEFIGRTCPRLVELTLRMREFWLSENWSGYLDYTHATTPFFSRCRDRNTRPILSLGIESDGTLGRKPSMGLRLPQLKRLTIVTIEIPGMLYTHDLDFMRPYDSEGKYVSASPKTCFWPQLEYFSIIYRDLPQVWHKDNVVRGLERLARRMKEIRPRVFVDFWQSEWSAN